DRPPPLPRGEGHGGLRRSGDRVRVEASGGRVAEEAAVHHERRAVRDRDRHADREAVHDDPGGLDPAGVRRRGDVRERDVAVPVVVGAPGDNMRGFIRMATQSMAPGEDLDRLYREGAAMYQLLGDPAIKPALPDEDLTFDVTPSEKGFQVAVHGEGLPDDAEV